MEQHAIFCCRRDIGIDPWHPGLDNANTQKTEHTSDQVQPIGLEPAVVRPIFNNHAHLVSDGRPQCPLYLSGVDERCQIKDRVGLEAIVGEVQSQTLLLWRHLRLRKSTIQRVDHAVSNFCYRKKQFPVKCGREVGYFQ